MGVRKYWLGVNGPSVAVCGLPLPGVPTVSPVPEQLIGFESLDEAASCQRYLLTAPVEDIPDYLRRLVGSGRVEYHCPAHSEPDLAGESFWVWRLDRP